MSTPSPAPTPPTTTTPTPVSNGSPAPAQQNGAKPPLRKIKREKREPTLFQKNPYRPIQVPVAKPPPPKPKKIKAEPDAVKLELKSDVKTEDSGSSLASSSTAASSGEALGYQEYKLMSCDRHGWRYDVMKFDSRKPVDIGNWERPVKLNRKELRRDPATGDSVSGSVATKPMLGPDGKPVIGADGRIVMVDMDGKPIHNIGDAAAASQKAKDKEKEKEKEKRKRKFQKKTKQVFLIPEHIRQLRREERYPWVIEDGTGGEVWVGRMEEAAKSETHALFMPATDQAFKFVPAYRWYKFQKRRETHQLVSSLEEAEKFMAKLEKNRDMDRWLVRSRNNAANGVAAPIAGGATTGASLVYDFGGRSLGPGGRRLKTVDAGMRGLFEEDDEEGVDTRRRRERQRGGEGDIDEMEYEDEFADDEEKADLEDTRDEEAKEIEERLKREYRSANKTREGYIDETDEEEEGEQQLTGAGKQMKKLVRKIEKNGAYDSDEEENPYASSAEEEEEEEPEMLATGVPQQQQPQRSPSQGPTSTPAPGSKPSSRPSSRPPSRTGSPAPTQSQASRPDMLTPPVLNAGMGMGGHSVVAKRATSPRPPAPKMKGAGSRATSPLAAGTGTGSRATSPVPISAQVQAQAQSASRAGSPVAPNVQTKKRKAEDGVAMPGVGTPVATGATGAAPGAPGAGGPPKPKKRKPAPPGSASSPTATSPPTSTPTSSVGGAAAASAAVGTNMPPITPTTELTQDLLIRWLRASPGATTRDCIQYFQPCLTDEAKKGRFTALVKEVASLKGGVLALKSQYARAE